MLADDFACGITLHPLCAGVPVGDDPARIEHVDSVVDDAIEEDTEAALAFEEGRLRFHPRGNVARDLGNADLLSGLASDGLQMPCSPRSGCRSCAPASLR
jgi:hypothetical protein